MMGVTIREQDMLTRLFKTKLFYHRAMFQGIKVLKLEIRVQEEVLLDLLGAFRELKQALERRK